MPRPYFYLSAQIFFQIVILEQQETIFSLCFGKLYFQDAKEL